mgnify:CR=1 FL=1
MPERNRLEVDEDRAFQEKFWTFQRIAWFFMALILVAALAGATGSGGPLAHGTASGPGGSIDYPRIARWQAAERMTVRLPPDAAGTASLELDGAFTRTFMIENIEPQPASSMATARGHRFEFDVGDGPGEKKIILHLRAASPALPVQAPARLGDGPPMPLRLLVLP